MPSNRRSNAQARGKQAGRGNARTPQSQSMGLDPTANDIVGVALVALAAAMTVALLVATPAPVTQLVGSALRLCFGGGSLLVPLAIMLFAITFFMDNYGPISGRIAIGLVMVVLAILSLMSLTCPGAEINPSLVIEHDVLLVRGGYVGGGIAWALLSSVGFGVGLVILIMLLVVGCVICGFSISGFVSKLRHQAKTMSADVQASRNRRAQERLAKRDEKRRLRAERAAYEAAGSYDSYQSYPDEMQQAEEGVADGVIAPVPVSTFLGDRKTRVLRRKPSDVQALSASGVGYAATDTPESGALQSLEQTLGSLPTRILHRKPKNSPGIDTANNPYIPYESSQEDLHNAEFDSQEDYLEDERLQQPSSSDDVSPTQQTNIPDFLRKQAQQANAKSDQSTEQDVNKPQSKKSGSRTSQGAPTGVVTRAKEPKGRSTEDSNYQLPPFSILSSNPHSAKSAAGESELASTMRRLQATLSEFGLKSRVVEYVAGPLVTTFHIEMGEGERVNRITSLEDDIALSLAAESVRIFAPIPGTSRVGIEIPNKKRETVHLGDVLPFAKGGPLEFAIGRDAAGKAVIADLAKMPHLLVAGATGSGKSVMINTLIMSILMRDTPKQVRLILVDPKRVEFSGYNGLPHLYVPVVTEPRQAASALQWAVSEMDRRLKVFERAGARNIGVYNEMCISGKLSEMDNPPEPMPFLVIIIDELSDLMMVAGKDVEASIVRIAQLARAAGIHLVLATQRPSADVVTGLIKSNIETRIALSVASNMDSRVILDQTGADKLLGNGDMLFKFKGFRTRRVLGCLVDDDEISAVVEHWRNQGQPDYHEEILTQVALSGSSGGSSASDGSNDDDPLVWEAAQIVVESQLGSTSGLQRRLKVGYARAGRIMDMLEAKGVVGPPDGSKPREVLLDEEGLEDLRVAEAQYREV